MRANLRVHRALWVVTLCAQASAGPLYLIQQLPPLVGSSVVDGSFRQLDGADDAAALAARALSSALDARFRGAELAGLVGKPLPAARFAGMSRPRSLDVSARGRAPRSALASAASFALPDAAAPSASAAAARPHEPGSPALSIESLSSDDD